MSSRKTKRSSLWGDLQSVNIMSSMVLKRSVYLLAVLTARRMTRRCLTASIFTPYLRLMRLQRMLGREVKLRMVYGILLALTALRMVPSSSLRMGRRFFSMTERAVFSVMVALPSLKELT